MGWRNASGNRRGHIGRRPRKTHATNATRDNVPLIKRPGTLAGDGGDPFGVVLSPTWSTAAPPSTFCYGLETQGLSAARRAEPDGDLRRHTPDSWRAASFSVPHRGDLGNGIVNPTIEFKPVGVRMSFHAGRLIRGVINLRIAPEVPRARFANGGDDLRHHHPLRSSKRDAIRPWAARRSELSP